MGLDMYLNRTIRVPGWKPEDYEEANETVAFEVFEKPAGPPLVIVHVDAGLVENYDPPVGTLEKARLLAPLEVREAVHVRGDSFKWFSIFEEVAYWRKANAVHSWFVTHVQQGVDECQYAEVTSEQLQTLRDLCTEVLRSKDPAPLQTRGGFFFGSTEYDEWYFKDLQETVAQVTKVIEGTDWKKQIVFYHSSW